MLNLSIDNIYKRYQTLRTHTIRALPVVILMPHSACNCRCIMCDIWKNNKNLKQLTEKDIRDLLVSLKKLDTKQVVMSGGEALLNPNFFRFCEILRKHDIKISLLSTGLTLKKNAEQIICWVNDVIISLDGDEILHNRIRNIPAAYSQLKDGVQHIKNTDPSYRITARTVIHRLNFRHWTSVIDSAREIGADQISFLPADVSSHAFNREVLWSDHRQHELLLTEAELEELKIIIEKIIDNHTPFIAESPDKLRKIYSYYAAFYGKSPFPYKRCNAPWVSAVVEADGTVRPCFFHAPLGNIHENSLDHILNSEDAIRFRRELDMDNDSTCIKCVCYLHLSPATKI